MFPWMIWWAPRLYFPWSGDVTQRIEPETNWFSDHIKSGAGEPDIEQAAFEVASYGKQLGLITEVLLDIAGNQALSSQESQTSLQKLRKIQAQITEIKGVHASSQLDQLIAGAEQLKRHNPEKFERLRKSLED